MSEPTAESEPLLNKQVQTDGKLPTPVTSTNSIQSNSNDRQEGLGYLFMLIAATGFSIHAFCIRLSESEYGVPFSVNLLCRGLIHFTFSTLYFMFAYPISTLITPSLSSRQIRLLAVRGCVGTISLLTLYYAVRFMPVGDAISIFFLVPIFTLLLSRIFLSEPVVKSDILAVSLSLLGAILIASSQPPDQSNGNEKVSTTMRIIGSGMVAFGAFLAAIAYTIVRHLGMGISFVSSIFSFSVFCAIGGVLVGGVPKVWKLLNGDIQRNGMLPVLGASLVSFLAQCGLNLGLQRARAGPAVLIANIEVPIVYVLSYVFLGERPSFLTIIGSTLIVSAALVVGIEKLQKRHFQT